MAQPCEQVAWGYNSAIAEVKKTMPEWTAKAGYLAMRKSPRRKAKEAEQ